MDLQYLTVEAKQNIIEFTTKRLPLQIRIAIAAGESAARELWKISQEAKDNKEKIQALVCFSNVHKNILHIMGEAGPYVTGINNQVISEMTPEEIQAMKEHERKVWAMQLK